jgi:MoxR-like ATPase
VFANFVLADEINRAPAKVQSALLEAMQEHQVSIGGQTFALPEPFLVLATQNPLEQEGTYPLPEQKNALARTIPFFIHISDPAHHDRRRRRRMRRLLLSG